MAGRPARSMTAGHTLTTVDSGEKSRFASMYGPLSASPQHSVGISVSQVISVFPQQSDGSVWCVTLVFFFIVM